MQSLLDLRGLLLAVVAGAMLVAAPGWTLARMFRFEAAAGGRDVPTALVAGLALLPLVDSMTIRAFGIDAAVGLALALAAPALVAAARAVVAGRVARPLGPIVAILLVWLAVVVAETVDVDRAGALYQPFTVIDMVKHAATTQAIVDSGAPPVDPFFLRPARVGYYYFFYAMPAVVERASFGLVDARAAVGGLMFWVGVGFYGLLRLAVAKSGAPLRRPGLLPLLCVALSAAGGLDILGVLRLGLLQGQWPADPVSWNEQVTGWFESLIWVPHHVTALVAAVAGLMVLAESPAQVAAARWRSVAFAALAFASTFGLSIWVALGLAGTLAVWGVVLLAERRWPALALLAGAAILAAGLAVPQGLDLMAGRVTGGGSPVVLTVRAFTPVDGIVPHGPWRGLARLVALPLNYLAAFGIFAMGTILYWRQRGEGPAFRSEFARVLAIAGATGLVLGTFLESTLFNNDLGWRVTLFPLLAGTVWTVLAVERVLGSPAGARRGMLALPALTLGVLVLGWTSNLYALFSLRLYPLLPIEAEHRFIAAHPATERALRDAYAWADRHLPPGAVLQHDPTRPRAFAFALYGRHRVAVADSFGSLFGADRKAVEARIDALAPIFQGDLTKDEVLQRAAAAGIDDLVVTADDPVWRSPGGFPWTVTPVYASDAVRIVSRASLEPKASTLSADLHGPPGKVD